MPMPPTLDVYRSWLGITIPDRPLTHYQLLRLPDFEDDPAKVRQHYRKMNTHVRKFAAGEYAKQSQDLLNELAKAMLCLTDAGRKAEYDASLGREAPAEGGKRRGLEELLLRRKVLDMAQLDKARKYAAAVGVELRDAVVQQKLVPADVATQLYAESLGLPFVDLAETTPDPYLLPKMPVLLARRHSCVPVMIDDDQLLVASPHPLKPEVEDEMRLRIGFPVRSVLCTVAGVQAVIDEHYPKEAEAAELAKAAQASKGGGGAAAPAADVDEYDPAAAKEARGRRMKVALITFNFAFMAVVFGLVFVGRKPFLNALYVAVPVGAAAAGTVFGTMTILKK